MLTDGYWLRLKDIMLKNGIYDKPNLRKTVEGLLYRMRTGISWRDLPEYFGHWNSVYQQFNRWSFKDKLMNIFNALIENPDLKWIFLDGTIVRSHQHSTGASSDSSEAIGKSAGGNTTKIHPATDGFGLPLDFLITEGQVNDVKIAPKLVSILPTSEYLIADRGYDSEALRNQIREKGMIPMCLRKRKSLTGNNDMDWDLYKYRHLVENAFARLKHFRAIATRYDKLEQNYKSMVALACAFIWLPI